MRTTSKLSPSHLTHRITAAPPCAHQHLSVVPTVTCSSSTLPTPALQYTTHQQPRHLLKRRADVSSSGMDFHLTVKKQSDFCALAGRTCVGPRGLAPPCDSWLGLAAASALRPSLCKHQPHLPICNLVQFLFFPHELFAPPCPTTGSA